MPSGIALVIWIVGMCAGVCFVSCSVIRTSFLRYFFLNLYIILSLFSDLLRQFVLRFYGLESAQYTYAYYYTDCLLTVALFVAVISLASRIFAELHMSKHVRLVAVLLLLGTAGLPALVISTFLGMNIRMPEWVNSSWAFETVSGVTIALTGLLWLYLKRQY